MYFDEYRGLQKKAGWDDISLDMILMAKFYGVFKKMCLYQEIPRYAPKDETESD